MTRRRLRKSSSTDSGEHKSLISDKIKNPLPPPSRRLLKRQQSSFDSILYWWNDQNNRKLLKRFHPLEQSESWFSIIWQASLIIVALLLCCYTFFWFDHFHYHLTRFYAQHVDDHHAQHVLGHKLIRNRSHPEAFQWFRKSANHGHAHSAYNLAVGHLSGYRTDVKPGEVRQLLRYAAKNGVEEAKELLRGLCREKPKYCDL